MSTKPTQKMFDETTEEDLEQGIAEAGRLLENRYIVRFPDLWVRFPNKHIYSIPLNPPKRVLQEIADMTPVEQMTHLIAAGDEDLRRRLDDEDDLPLVALSYKYAEILAKVQGASLGKYSPSSH